MRIELHLLQNFAPSNLNRDDTGAPKDAEFGGCRRARISSQCQKRAIRSYFGVHGLIPAANRGIRTKRLLEYTRAQLQRPGRDDDAISRAVTAALAGGGLKLDEKNLTQYLLFLGASEVARFVEVVDRHFDELTKTAAPAAPAASGAPVKATTKKAKADAKTQVPEAVQRAVPALLDGGKAADLALFGRMLADLPDKNIDAACQVAHAISTNALHALEMDYYTAVDDINNDTPGADMIGTVEFNSACFYRYANLDVAELIGGYRDEKHTCTFGLQGDVELARTTVTAFIQAFIDAIPSGKQNSFAAHNPPSFVFAAVRTGQPVSLANAFVKPVAPGRNKDLVELSIEALDKFYGELVRMYGDGGLTYSAVCQMADLPLNNMKPAVGTIKDLIAGVIGAAFPQGGAA